MIGMHRGCRSAIPPFCFQIESTGKIALVTADDKDGGEKDTCKKVVFWQKQREKDANTDPEHDKTNRLSHKFQ